MVLGARRTPASRSPSIRSSATSCRRGSRRGSRGRDSASSRETLAFLAERCEGNLLAARQEIEKLGLLLPEGELAADAVERAVTDVARYDVFQLSEAWLAGDAARALRIIAALEAEGEGIQLLLWQLGEDLHALASVLDGDGGGHADRDRDAQRARLGQAAGGDRARGARVLEPDAIAPLLARARAARRAVQRHRPRQRVGRAAHARRWRSPASRRCRCRAFR